MRTSIIASPDLFDQFDCYHCPALTFSPQATHHNPHTVLKQSSIIQGAAFLILPYHCVGSQVAVSHHPALTGGDNVVSKQASRAEDMKPRLLQANKTQVLHPVHCRWRLSGRKLTLKI